VTFPAESTLDDVICASFALGHVLAQGVAARDERRRFHQVIPWWQDVRIVHGLTAALHILDERSDALRRHREGPGA
jgi:hypothetical protein